MLPYPTYHKVGIRQKQKTEDRRDSPLSEEKSLEWWNRCIFIYRLHVSSSFGPSNFRRLYVGRNIYCIFNSNGEFVNPGREGHFRQWIWKSLAYWGKSKMFDDTRRCLTLNKNSIDFLYYCGNINYIILTLLKWKVKWHEGHSHYCAMTNINRFLWKNEYNEIVQDSVSHAKEYGLYSICNWKTLMWFRAHSTRTCYFGMWVISR